MLRVSECNSPWTWMLISSNGEVKPCCFSPGNIGNLNDSSAEDIWNGKKIIELRAYIKKNELHPICDGSPCEYVTNITNKGNDKEITENIFDEERYLALNPDVALAVKNKIVESGFKHYIANGKEEGRLI